MGGKKSSSIPLKSNKKAPKNILKAIHKYTICLPQIDFSKTRIQPSLKKIFILLKMVVFLPWDFSTFYFEIIPNLQKSYKNSTKNNFLCVFVCLFCFSMAAPTAYRSSQARGWAGLQLLAYTTATATWDPSHVCDLRHSSWQCRIVNPLSEARDGTHIPMNPSWVR